MHARALVPALVLAAGACSTPSQPAPPTELASAAAPTATVAATAAPIDASPCSSPAASKTTLFVSPRVPIPGSRLRVLAVTDAPREAALVVRDDTGAEIAGSRERRGGSPYWWYAELASAPSGRLSVSLRGAGAAACTDVDVPAAVVPAKNARVWGKVWPARAAWDHATEALYSAWIEKLFDAPVGESLTFAALHEALRDPARNLLHDHRGVGEDDGGPTALPIDPDCADLPYFLRAYFAHKLDLPFGFSSCTRGGGGLPPRCLKWHSSLEPGPARSNPEDAFVEFLRVKLADTVHSGTGRVPVAGDEGDYYPVTLSLESLRPGTVYTDPYGHVLVVASRVPQKNGGAGVLYAVDGQPDGTVSRRRFWRGNFLFALDAELGSAGWKRFRPVVVDASGHPRALTNREIAADPAYGDLSMAQYEHGVEGFYDAMDDLLSPEPLDPTRALLETLDALDEQVKGRVLSVQNAKKHFATGGGTIDMPEGSSIFETTGPWEDYSTPSRDLRLLIAIDVARGLPDRVARRPERFAIPAGRAPADVKAELVVRLGEELARRRFTYERSDGSAFSLSLADVVARAAELEIAYDPNDCPEVRWGAPAGSAEIATCTRRSSPGQAARMRRYRPWFASRKRPPRP